MLSMFVVSTGAHAASEPNLALNLNKTGYPELTASYTCGCDDVWSTVNGAFIYDPGIHDRWTSYYSGTETDWVAVDFGAPTSFNQVKLYVFNDGGGVQTPANYLIQYWNGSSWVDAPNQTRTPEIPEAALASVATPENTLNTASFDTVTSNKLQIVFTNKSGSTSGLVELEVFLHQSVDESAAAPAIAQIAQLPIQASVALPDKTAIAAARTAYDLLTVSQKSLVTNLSKLTEAEAAIAALEAAQLADISAASAVMTQIAQLPLQAAVALPDKMAIAAARTAYDLLTVSQKSLVTNLSKLTEAEAAIAVLEAPRAKDVAVLSAFGNVMGNTITLKVSSVLDATYSMQASNFQVIANAVPVPVTTAVYDPADSSYQTIKLTFSSPVLLNETLVTLSLQSGAFQTNNNEFNNAVPFIPVVTFKKLDWSQDNRIGVDDLVRMLSTPALQTDMNQDGNFDREDALLLLSRISSY